MRAACVLSVAVLPVLCLPASAVAQNDGLAIEAAAGFDGTCRSGDWCPLRVVLANEGASVEGELRVEVESAGLIEEPDAYTTRVVLPTHSRKAYTLYLPSGGAHSASRWVVALVSDGSVLGSVEVPVSWARDGERLYGVAGRSGSSFGFLADVVPAGGRAVVARLDLEALPPDPLGWGALDVLVLDDVDTTVLDAAQVEALAAWVDHGGHLVVGGGAGAARTAAGLGDLLPVAVGGTRSVDDLQALGEQVGAETLPGPYALAGATPGEGDVLLEQDGVPLLVRCARGVGYVDFLAFGAGLSPFAAWADTVDLWKWIIQPDVGRARHFGVRDGYASHDAVNMIPGLEPPSTLQILGFMLVYTLLVGPANYVVLRKLDRRELAWLTIPLLVVGFTLLAYLTGFQIRGSEAIVHRLATVVVPAGSGQARVTQAVGLFSPRRTRYDVRVAGSGLRAMSSDGYYYPEPSTQALCVVDESDGLTVRDLRVDIGGIQPFLVEGYAAVDPVEAAVSLVANDGGRLQLEGTLRNGSVKLEDAVVLAGAGHWDLGDLEAGEEACFSLGVAASGASSNDLPEQILGTASYYGDDLLQRRYSFLRAIFPYGESVSLGAYAYLVGWADAGPLDVEVAERPYTTVESALYVYVLPLGELEPGVTVTVGPDLIARDVVESDAFVDEEAGTVYLEAGGMIVYRFAVPSAVLPADVEELRLALEHYRGLESTVLVPAVYLWNVADDDWERVDAGWGDHAISNGGDYVSPAGVVLLRLAVDEEDEMVDVSIPSIALKGRR
jgi:hypothetical protein